LSGVASCFQKAQRGPDWQPTSATIARTIQRDRCAVDLILPGYLFDLLPFRLACCPIGDRPHGSGVVPVGIARAICCRLVSAIRRIGCSAIGTIGGKACGIQIFGKTGRRSLPIRPVARFLPGVWPPRHASSAQPYRLAAEIIVLVAERSTSVGRCDICMLSSLATLNWGARSLKRARQEILRASGGVPICGAEPPHSAPACERRPCNSRIAAQLSGAKLVELTRIWMGFHHGGRKGKSRNPTVDWWSQRTQRINR
jgi:hypothetical protein